MRGPKFSKLKPFARKVALPKFLVVFLISGIFAPLVTLAIVYIFTTITENDKENALLNQKIRFLESQLQDTTTRLEIQFRDGTARLEDLLQNRTAHVIHRDKFQMLRDHLRTRIDELRDRQNNHIDNHKHP